MLGQFSLFKTKNAQSIRQRVRVTLITPYEARHVLRHKHYLRRTRVGRQINYAVFVDDKVDGVITFAHPMISVPIADIPSDELIEFARLYLDSNVPLVASCAIRKVLRRIKKDWMREYPKSKVPRAVVSWSDITIHKGTIYKASNFVWYRRVPGKMHNNTSSSKRGFRYEHNDYKNAKDCWLYPLNNKDKKHLGELLSDVEGICNNE